MKYDVYYSGDLEGLPDTFGIEFQPPIGRHMFENIIGLLSMSENEYLTGTEHLVEKGVVTRDDSVGTAAIIERNYQVTTTSFEIAHKIGLLIDPCGQHDVAVHDTQS